MSSFFLMRRVWRANFTSVRNTRDTWTSEREADKKEQSTGDSRCKMARVDVPDQRMNSDGRAPARNSAAQKHLQKGAGRLRTPYASQQEQACRGDSPTKSSTVVGNQRDEARKHGDRDERAAESSRDLET